MLDSTKPRARALVLDTAAFLSGTDSIYALYGLRDVNGKAVRSLDANEEVQFFTTPDVVQEVKDPNARARLKLLEDLITLRIPSKEALAAVIEFAKASGDYSVLSVTDLRVVALARMLEFERNGTEFLRLKPEVPYITASRGIPAHVLDKMEEAEDREREARAEGEPEDQWTTVSVKKRTNVEKSKKKKKKWSTVPMAESVKASGEVEPDAIADREADREANTERIAEVCIESENMTQAEGTSLETPEFSAVSDDEGWITAENLDMHLAQSREEHGGEPVDDMRVGCVTTDFAMQNILLQMGIKIISTDGRRVIRQTRRYVLRCHACTNIARDLERKFCDRCGNATLHRVAFKVNKQGVARVFVNPKRKPNLRGTKYSIPMPKGGRHNNDLILREDQVDMVKQRRLQKQRSKLNAESVLSENVFYNAGAKFSVVNDRTVVGYGRRNPNESRPGAKSRKR